MNQLARRIAAFDWSATALGPLAHWPRHALQLRTVPVSISST